MNALGKTETSALRSPLNKPYCALGAQDTGLEFVYSDKCNTRETAATWFQQTQALLSPLSHFFSNQK